MKTMKKNVMNNSVKMINLGAYILKILHLYIQSDISKHHLNIISETFFRVQISSDEQPVCNILLPLSCFGLLNGIWSFC